MSSRWPGRPVAGAVWGSGCDSGCRSRAVVGPRVRPGFWRWPGCGNSGPGALARLGEDGLFGSAVRGGLVRWLGADDGRRAGLVGAATRVGWGLGGVELGWD